MYVTNHIAENKDSLWQILDGGGHIYVCGYVSVDCLLHVTLAIKDISATPTIGKNITKVLF